MPDPIVPVTKAQLPRLIAGHMTDWRSGEAAFPLSYIVFHMELATKRLEVLRTTYDLKLESVSFGSDGWGDGMKVLSAVCITPSGKRFPLQWCDGNQDFMRGYDPDHGGHGSLLSSDLI